MGRHATFEAAHRRVIGQTYRTGGRPSDPVTATRLGKTRAMHRYRIFIRPPAAFRTYGWLLCSLLLLSCENAQESGPLLWQPVDDVNFFLIEDSFFRRIAEKSLTPSETAVSVRRNSMGTALILTGQRENPNSILRADARGSFTYREFTSQGIIDDNLNPVVSFSESDEGYIFPNGEIVSVRQSETFEVDLRRSYFLVSMNAGGTRVASVASPEETLIERREPLEWIFTSPDGDIHLFSRNYDAKGRQSGVRWFHYRETGGQYVVHNEILIPRRRAGHSPYVVVDCDSVRRVVVLKDVRDPPFDGWTAYYAFDSDAQQLRKLTSTRKRWNEGFFLNADFASNLNDVFESRSKAHSTESVTPEAQ